MSLQQTNVNNNDGDDDEVVKNDLLITTTPLPSLSSSNANRDFAQRLNDFERRMSTSNMTQLIPPQQQQKILKQPMSLQHQSALFSNYIRKAKQYI